MRLFLALETSGIREELRALQSRLRPLLSGWRWTPPENIHLTLRFLGEVEQEQDRELRERWRLAAAGIEPFRVRAAGLGRFPPRGRARVLWLGVDEPGSHRRLHALAEALEREAREAGFAPERRPFGAHLTLARSARSGAPAEPPDAAFEWERGLRVEELVLLLSRLSPAGARYTTLERFPLGR